MKLRPSLVAFALSVACSVFASGQGSVVVADPTKTEPEAKLSAAEQNVFDKALPAVRKKISSDICEDSVEVAGVVRGAFSRPASQQTLIFYQYCQTGNGLGWAGIVLIEAGKVVGNFIADAGWTFDAGSLPDINMNGLDEFTLSYGGGMHQGQGGVGVDIMEFSAGRPKGIGWFLAEKFTDTETTTVWKVTVKTGKVPIYYRQKYIALEGGKYRRSGGPLLFKLAKPIGSFEVVK
jgi:hypothetical protein